MDALKGFSDLQLKVGNITVAPTVVQAGIIIFLIFLLLLVMAKITRSYISWYTSGWYIWVALGFVMAVVIEGFFVVSGSTIFTAVLGWKRAPKPVQTVLDSGRSKLINVLGAEDEVPTKESVKANYEKLDLESREEFVKMICEPE